MTWDDVRAFIAADLTRQTGREVKAGSIYIASDFVGIRLAYPVIIEGEVVPDADDWHWDWYDFENDMRMTP
jgi:hypothetical protein